MINVLLRGVIVYLAVIIAVRLMGKRQIGQLQPSELVVTILLSEVAATPLENSSVPIASCLAVLFLLACFEVLFSCFSARHEKFRKAVEGSSVMVIRKGRILQKSLRELRYSIDDLLEALRLKDVFDVAEVDFAYIETNGSLSVKLKKQYRPPTPDDESSHDGSIPYVIISEGKIMKDNFEYCAMSRRRLEKALQKKKLTVKDVYLMTADAEGQLYIVEKEVEKQ